MMRCVSSAGAALGAEGQWDRKTGPGPLRWKKLVCPGLRDTHLSRRPLPSGVLRGSFLVSVPFSYVGRVRAAILRSDYLEDPRCH